MVSECVTLDLSVMSLSPTLGSMLGVESTFKKKERKGKKNINVIFSQYIVPFVMEQL